MNLVGHHSAHHKPHDALHTKLRNGNTKSAGCLDSSREGEAARARTHREETLRARFKRFSEHSCSGQLRSTMSSNQVCRGVKAAGECEHARRGDRHADVLSLLTRLQKQLKRQLLGDVKMSSV